MRSANLTRRPACQSICMNSTTCCPSMPGVPTTRIHFSPLRLVSHTNLFSFCVGHVCHGSELPFVFHTAAPFFNFTAGEEQLSRQIVTYWTNLARTGNPNTGLNTPTLSWPQYQNNNGLYPNIKLTIPLAVENNFDASYCDFWDTLGYEHGV